MALIATEATGNYLPGYSVEQITLTKDHLSTNTKRDGWTTNHTLSHVSFISLHSGQIQLHATDCLTVITWETT